MPKIISMLQQKGGVGKTTIAVHLAAQVREFYPMLRVVIADADPQQSASTWIRKDNGKADVGVTRVAADGQGRFLRNELATISSELIILDLPPAISAVSQRAALLSDLVLVPIGASALDVEAARSAIALCREAIQLDASKKFLLVPNRIQQSTCAGREIRAVLSRFGPVSRTTLCLRVGYADAVMRGVGINKFAPGSIAHQEVGLLAEEVAELLNFNIYGRKRNET